ncbi:MAG: phage integrase central domain-containing protein, partial [Chloroflexota bacterium]
MSFKACSEAYIDAHKASWRNAKHADQWRNTLDTYAWP